MDNNEQEQKFSEIFDELEACIEQLESGDLELEDSLERYSQGVRLLAKLHEKLDASEVIIKELSGKIERDAEEDATSISHA